MVTTAAGHKWLLDCGRQAPDQLHDAGVSWHELTGQIITHVHGDHVYGLEDFAFRRFYEGQAGIEAVRAGGPKPGLMVHSAVRDELWEMLAPVLKYVPGNDDPAAGTLADYFDEVAPQVVAGPKHNAWNHAEQFSADGLSLIARECLHVPGKPSTSLEIEVGERLAWWSGDSTVDVPWLSKIEPKTNIFFHDCTFVDYPGQVHGSFSLLKTLPESVRKKMVLMHHEDDIESHRTEAEALGFRLAMPGQTYDLVTGQRLD